MVLRGLCGEEILSERVFPALNHLLRDLLPQFDRIERLVLRQPPQDRQLCPQHVAFGNGGNHLACGGFDLLHRLRQDTRASWQPATPRRTRPCAATIFCARSTADSMA